MARVLLRDANHHRAILLRVLSSAPASSSVFNRHFQTGNGNNNNNSAESGEEFERRLFGNTNQGGSEDPFFRKLDRFDRARDRSNSLFEGLGSRDQGNSSSSFIDGSGPSFDSLQDGMDDELEKAAQFFEYTDEVYDEDYSFRHDVNYFDGATYEPKDLDLTKPGVQRDRPRLTFETSTAEVLKKADFRNVRFLANFITEAGIIIKRSHTKISAKAQRKVAREIKTARAFGLMPFTTMGTKQFVFGRSMKDDEEEFYDYDEPDADGDDVRDVTEPITQPNV